MGNTGIYEILNVVNNKRYIGQSIDITQRLSSHKSTLKNGSHSNVYLQHSVEKYGLKAFIFKKILECSKDDLNFYEDLIIKGYKSNKRDFGYNLREVSSSNKGMMTRRNTHKPGDKYNRLTLIKPLGQKADTRIWLCKCDCGNTIEVQAGPVKNGHTKSCGCWNTDQLKNRNKEIAGTKYNRLTLVKEMGRDDRRKVLWLVKCDCGVQKTIQITLVRTGTVKSCGCLRSETSSAHLKRVRAKASLDKEKLH